MQKDRTPRAYLTENPITLRQLRTENEQNTSFDRSPDTSKITSRDTSKLANAPNDRGQSQLQSRSKSELQSQSHLQSKSHPEVTEGASNAASNAALSTKQQKPQVEQSGSTTLERPLPPALRSSINFSNPLETDGERHDNSWTQYEPGLTAAGLKNGSNYNNMVAFQSHLRSWTPPEMSFFSPSFNGSLHRRNMTRPEHKQLRTLRHANDERDTRSEANINPAKRQRSLANDVRNAQHNKKASSSDFSYSREKGKEPSTSRSTVEKQAEGDNSLKSRGTKSEDNVTQKQAVVTRSSLKNTLSDANLMKTSNENLNSSIRLNPRDEKHGKSKAKPKNVAKDEDEAKQNMTQDREDDVHHVSEEHDTSQDAVRDELLIEGKKSTITDYPQSSESAVNSQVSEVIAQSSREFSVDDGDTGTLIRSSSTTLDHRDAIDNDENSSHMVESHTSIHMIESGSSIGEIDHLDRSTETTVNTKEDKLAVNDKSDADPRKGSKSHPAIIKSHERGKIRERKGSKSQPLIQPSAVRSNNAANAKVEKTSKRSRSEPLLRRKRKGTRANARRLASTRIGLQNESIAEVSGEELSAVDRPQAEAAQKTKKKKAVDKHVVYKTEVSM